jgi:hypothetical protein
MPRKGICCKSAPYDAPRVLHSGVGVNMLALRSPLADPFTITVYSSRASLQRVAIVISFKRQIFLSDASPRETWRAPFGQGPRRHLSSLVSLPQHSSVRATWSDPSHRELDQTVVPCAHLILSAASYRRYYGTQKLMQRFQEGEILINSCFTTLLLVPLRLIWTKPLDLRNMLAFDGKTIAALLLLAFFIHCVSIALLNKCRGTLMQRRLPLGLL